VQGGVLPPPPPPSPAGRWQVLRRIEAAVSYVARAHKQAPPPTRPCLSLLLLLSLLRLPRCTAASLPRCPVGAAVRAVTRARSRRWRCCTSCFPPCACRRLSPNPVRERRGGAGGGGEERRRRAARACHAELVDTRTRTRTYACTQASGATVR
jgi:hypothetical protein